MGFELYKIFQGKPIVGGGVEYCDCFVGGFNDPFRGVEELRDI